MALKYLYDNAAQQLFILTFHTKDKISLTKFYSKNVKLLLCKKNNNFKINVWLPRTKHRTV